MEILRFHILHFSRKDVKISFSSHRPSLFCDFFSEKDVRTMFSGSFTSFSSLYSPEKGGGNSQLKGFHILRILSKEGKTRKNNSFPSFTIGGGM